MKNGGADAPPFFVSGPRAGMAKLADARDLKSCVREDIRVRSPVPASLPAPFSSSASAPRDSPMVRPDLRDRSYKRQLPLRFT